MCTYRASDACYFHFVFSFFVNYNDDDEWLIFFFIVALLGFLVFAVLKAEAPF